MSKKEPYLKPEEWAFSLDGKDWLQEEWEHCWIPNEQTSAALKYEQHRSLLKEVLKHSDQEPSSKNKDMLERPFVCLRKSEKRKLCEINSTFRGVYGHYALIDLDVNTIPEDPESTYNLFIAWDFEDSHLLASFKKFLEKNRGDRKATMPIPSGKKRSGRVQLKKLAALRLSEEFQNEESVSKFVSTTLIGPYFPVERLIYRSSSSFDNAVSSKRKEISNIADAIRNNGHIDLFLQS